MGLRNTSTSAAVKPNATLGYLIALEACVVVWLLCLYKKSTSAWSEFLHRPAGLVLLVTTLVAVGLAALVARECFRSRRAGVRACYLALATNLLTAVVILVLGEAAVRMVANDSLGSVTVRGMLLPPQHDWRNVVAANRRAIDRAGTAGDWSRSYQVPNDVLGWTIGPDRRSEDGLYSSSPEGLRSPTVGYSFAAPAGTTRIAVVGDSHTFGLEVAYEDTWARQLEKRLGPGFQILNFGVDGFGVDQALLRYQREVDAWAPKLVIFTVLSHDFYRSTSVYPFITFQWEMPFAKPRFTTKDGSLVRVNPHFLSPEEIVRVPDVSDLPFLKYEPGYRPEEWHRTLLHGSYLVRLLMASFPPWTPPSDEVSERELRAVNIALIRAVVEKAHAQGTRLLLVYLPSKGESANHVGSSSREALSILAAAAVPYVDGTSWLAPVPPERRYLQWHETPEANRAIAAGIEGLVRAALVAN
jgi:hypothetical protein